MVPIFVDLLLLQPAFPPSCDIPLATFLSRISSNIWLVPSGTIHPNGSAGLPVMSLLLAEMLKLFGDLKFAVTSS